MAVTRTGSLTDFHSSNNNTSTAVTVPADAKIMVLGITGIPNAAVANIFSNPPTLGGNAMTKSRDDDANGNAVAQCIYTYVNPPTGSQTLAWNFSGTGTILLGAHFIYAFYKDVDTASAIGATAGSQDGDNSATTGSMAATSGDAVFALGGGYSSGGSPTLSWTNATELSDDNYNGTQGSGAEAFPAAAVTLTVANAGTGTIATTISAIVIKQSAAAGRTTKNTDAQPLGVFAGVSRRVSNTP